jgi:hypothetical protein
MKKLVAIAVVFALVTGVVFAADGVNINAWGRGAFAPLIVKFPGETWDGKKWTPVKEANVKGKMVDKTADAFVGVGPTWGGNKVRVDFRIVGDSEFIGFGLNATAEDNSLAGNDDAAYIYAKPFGGDILKIKIGLLVEHELRGKLGTANNTFDNFVVPHSIGGDPEDRIFTRFAAFGTADHQKSNHIGGSGILLTSKPIDGLFIGLMANGGNVTPSAANKSAFDAYNYMQIGAGYVIPNIGHVRAQWIGGYAGTYDKDKLFDIKNIQDGDADLTKPARIEAAVALTAVDGLLVDLGGKFWLPVDDETKKNAAGAKTSKGIGIGLGATFRKEAFSLAFHFDGDFGAYSRAWKKDDSTQRGAMDFRLTPAYDLEPCTVGLALGFKTDTPATDAKGKEEKSVNLKGKSVAFLPTMQLGAAAFAQKGLGKGSIKAGLAFTSAPIYDGHAKASESPYFSIPIILEYAFF